MAWLRIGYIGKEREHIEIQYSKLISDFTRRYQEEAKKKTLWSTIMRQIECLIGLSKKLNQPLSTFLEMI